MAFNNEVKNRILENAQIGKIVGESVTLKSRYGHLVGLCPFHPEKTPKENDGFEIRN